MQEIEISAVNLLCALGFEQIKVEMQSETVFEVKIESCLELLLCRLALSFIWIFLHILFLNSD